jgi:hypothetical protein
MISARQSGGSQSRRPEARRTGHAAICVAAIVLALVHALRHCLAAEDLKPSLCSSHRFNAVDVLDAEA